MRDLNYQLKNLVKTSREGSYGTQAARHRVLQQVADTLHTLGYTQLAQADGLKPKHVEALVSHWQQMELSAGTIKNRMAHLRWWANKIGKPAIIARDNDHYQIERRTYVSGDSKAKALDTHKLVLVNDPYTRMSLQLQAAFGLRREEAIKFNPSYADKGDKLALKATWTKGGKARDIPIRNQAQRDVLAAARRLAGRGSLIAQHRNYVQQLRVYEKQTVQAGLDKNHGLRHAYAQQRYYELTGQLAPAAGGCSRRELDKSLKQQDQEARLVISRELGHERIAIVAVYCG